MELWSKGLGTRVLSLRLGERKALTEKSRELVIEGVMHAPVYWDYTVSLGEVDVVDFLELLKKPGAVKFLVRSRSRGTLLRTALSSGLVFLVRMVRLLLGAAGTPDRAPQATDSDCTGKGPVG